MPSICKWHDKLPRRPFLITSPIWLGLVGSPTTQASGTCWLIFIHSTIFTVPKSASASSSPVIIKLIDPRSGVCSMNSATAATKAAIPPFMSAAPRPNSFPSCTTPLNGSCCHFSRSPTGTTSVWPAKAKCGPLIPRRAKRLSMRATPVPNGNLVQSKPNLLSSSCIKSSAPPSAGVTDGQRTRSCAS